MAVFAWDSTTRKMNQTVAQLLSAVALTDSLGVLSLVNRESGEVSSTADLESTPDITPSRFGLYSGKSWTRVLLDPAYSSTSGSEFNTTLGELVDQVNRSTLASGRLIESQYDLIQLGWFRRSTSDDNQYVVLANRNPEVNNKLVTTQKSFRLDHPTSYMTTEETDQTRVHESKLSSLMSMRSTKVVTKNDRLSSTESSRVYSMVTSELVDTHVDSNLMSRSYSVNTRAVQRPSDLTYRFSLSRPCNIHQFVPDNDPNMIIRDGFIRLALNWSKVIKTLRPKFNTSPTYVNGSGESTTYFKSPPNLIIYWS